MAVDVAGDARVAIVVVARKNLPSSGLAEEFGLKFWQQENHTQPVTGTGWMAVDVVVGDARVTIVRMLRRVVRMLRREVKNLVKKNSTSTLGSAASGSRSGSGLGSASGSAEEILAKSVDNPFHSAQLAGVSRNPYSR